MGIMTWVMRLFMTTTILAMVIMILSLSGLIKVPYFYHPSQHFALSKDKAWLKYFSMVGHPDKEKDLLVCSIATLNPGKFILFSTGFRRNKKDTFSSCTINGKPVTGKRIGPDLFECEETSYLNEDDILSIQLSDGTIMPSLAVWSDRTPLSIGDHPKIPVCIMTMMKNEEGKIADWTEYHIRQGVGLFLVYNNNSTDNTLCELQQYSQVVVIDWPWKKSQNEMLLHGVLHMKEVCEWVFHMDVDEYIFPNADNASYTMRQLMSLFPKWVNSTTEVTDAVAVDQVCLDTKVMGTSGHIHFPKLPVTEAYIDIHRWWYIAFGKCAVRPTRALPKSGIHRFSVPGRTVRLLRTAAQLIHYKWQCWDHFVRKYDKGRASGNTNDLDKRNLDKDKPQNPWLKIYMNVGPNDTTFRDYKRIVDKWPSSGEKSLRPCTKR